MSGASSNRKGKQFERDAANYATERLGIEVSRRAALGLPDDEGDLFGIPDATVQCKNTTRIDLAGFVDSAEDQGEAAGTSQRVALIKRRMKPIGDAYVVMTYDRWLDIQELLIGQER